MKVKISEKGTRRVHRDKRHVTTCHREIGDLQHVTEMSRHCVTALQVTRGSDVTEDRLASDIVTGETVWASGQIDHDLTLSTDGDPSPNCAPHSKPNIF